MDQTLIRGDVTELQCILAFQELGYYCSIPFSGSCKYDVVVDINSKLIRVQCKSSVYHEEDGTLRFNGTRQTTNTKGTTKYTYSKNDIDYFYTYWNNHSFLIPVEEISTYKYLRVDKPLHGIQENMSIASDYLLEKVIDSIEQNKPIEKYKDNRIISIDEDGKEINWTTNMLREKYTDAQIKYIKENILKEKPAYGLNWQYKEFPSL